MTAQDDVYAYLTRNPMSTMEQMYSALDMPKGTIRSALHRMKLAGKASSTGEGQYSAVAVKAVATPVPVMSEEGRAAAEALQREVMDIVKGVLDEVKGNGEIYKDWHPNHIATLANALANGIKTLATLKGWTDKTVIPISLIIGHITRLDVSMQINTITQQINALDERARDEIKIMLIREELDRLAGMGLLTAPKDEQEQEEER